jgi:predicted nucleic acid-binding protein
LSLLQPGRRHLAALAIEHQAVLHFNDSDFSRFPGLRWHNPLP